MVFSRSFYIFQSQNSIFRPMIVAALFAATIGVHVTHAQTTDSEKSKAKSHSEMDISLGMFGQLTSTRTRANSYSSPDGSTLFTQDTAGNTSSVGVLGTFHQTFRPWLGYNVNFGYTRLSEVLSSGSRAISAPPQSIHNFYFFRGSTGLNMYELTAAPVIQGPRITRMDTFAQLGGGVSAFLPTNDSSPYGVKFRPTMIFGAGMNYKLSPHWALRAEYRGLLYKNPDFSTPSVTALYNVTHEPTVSFVYRFGGKK